MAFNKAPSQSTYQSTEVKLRWSLANRDQTYSKDPILTNGFLDLIKDKATQDEMYFAVKRDGAFVYSNLLVSTNIRGLYHWEDEDKLYIAYDDSVLILTASTGVLETAATLFLTTTGEVAFTSFFYEDGNTKVVIGDGVRLWTLDEANVAVLGASPDFPTPYKPSFLFLDGYLFVIKEGTSDIYNSNLNDPLAWTAGDFISAEMLPDTMLRLARVNNYVLAFGSNSIEYFFDAGNAAGSPLQRNDTPVKLVGYLGGLAIYGNKLIFVGQYENTTPSIFILEDFKMEEIESPFIKKLLQPLSVVKGAMVSNGGHDFYILTLTDKSFVYDFEYKTWYRWKFAATEKFPITFAAQVNLSYGHVSVFTMEGSNLLHTFAPTIYQDGTTPFTFECLTAPMTFDTQRQKFMSKLFVVGDRVASDIAVAYSDDDYQTFSADRLMSLDTHRPALHQLGKFVRRVFRTRHTANTPCRLFHLEVDFNIGKR